MKVYHEVLRNFLLCIIVGLLISTLYNIKMQQKEIKIIKDIQYEIIDKIHETYRVE